MSRSRVEVALNLSKRSDPCYQTYFKALSDLGVSIEGVHNRVYASRSMTNLRNELYNPETSAPLQGMKNLCGKSGMVRLSVDSSEWFQVCYLLFRLAGQQPQEQTSEIVCDSSLLPSKDQRIGKQSTLQMIHCWKIESHFNESSQYWCGSKC